jgi:A/G-specific adenine glycosylase
MTLAAQSKKRKQPTPTGAKAVRLSVGRRPQPAALLEWYDRNRRVLPWRVCPQTRADPYRVWLSEIMLQQTSVRTVAPYFQRFVARWPTVEALAAASLDDVLKLWAGLGYYARARNLHVCAQAVTERWGGQFPQTERELASLPGIGAYTAAAVAAIAFDVRTAAVDGNVERVLARLFAVEASLPAAKPRIRELAQSILPEHRAGDFAQALMDLGATVCTPTRPACMLCPWRADCAGRQSGSPEFFPRKARKRVGETRRGAAFVLLRADNAVLLRRRPDEGLLGGMTEVPTSEWTSDFDEAGALSEAPRPACAAPQWRRLAGVVEHAFTHFPLELFVYRATVGRRTAPPSGTRWVALPELAGEALPSLMRKVLTHALGDLLGPEPLRAAHQ